MMILYAGIGIALACFIIYVLDRKSKSEPLQWDVAGKLSTIGGLIASGIAFVTSGDIPIAETVAEVAKSVPEEMFVGTPTF
uniref:Uncharacterized protein n=1 Tax=viral metagenome TaxID=1070528 RepID=A0A6C0JZW0_9ZZZZ